MSVERKIGIKMLVTRLMLQQLLKCCGAEATDEWI